MTELAEQNDQRLLDDYCRSGSAVAFDELMSRHRQLVVGVCRRVLGNLHDAEDAAQATFVALMRKAPSLQVERTLAGWLYVAAVASARALQRSLARRGRHERGAAKAAGRGEPADPAHDAADERIDRLLAALPTEQRDALVVRFLEGRTEAEAAMLLGCPVRTLHNRVARGLARLRARVRVAGDPALALPALLGALAGAHVPDGVAASASGAAHIVGVSGARVIGAGGSRWLAWAGIAALGAGLTCAAVVGAAPAPAPVASPTSPSESASSPAPATPAVAILAEARVARSPGSSISGLALQGGDTLWSSGYDQALRGWDAATLAPRLAIAGPALGMRGLAVSRDGRLLAVALEGGHVLLRDRASGASRQVDGLSDDATAVAISPDGSVVAASGRGGDGALWDVADGAMRARIPPQGDHLWAAAFAPDGRSVALLGDTREFWTYDARSGRPWCASRASRRCCAPSPSRLMDPRWSPGATRASACGMPRAGIRSRSSTTPAA